MLGICPTAQLIDISHKIPAYAITEAAFTLAQAWRYFPRGTVHLVVVDPGVGSSRRPLSPKLKDIVLWRRTMEYLPWFLTL